MIDYITGNILEDTAEALVNTVNTVGVMGKGIALQFKRRFPDNYEAYRRACKADGVEPGRMFVWPTGQLRGPEYIINFPTKRHWKGKSRIDDIEAGLRDLKRVVVDLQIGSLAVPPLGCGNGGLNWSNVRPLIDSYLSELEGVRIRVYQPAGAPAPAAMPAYPSVPRLTVHRAAMLASFARYLRPGYSLGRLEAQKLVYFLQVVGAPYEKLQFTQGIYGPYSSGILHVLNQIEGHFIEGFGDAAAPSAIRLREDAVVRAEALLEDDENKAFRDAVEAVASLTAGFDDAFGLELLASVHWVATHGDSPARNGSEAVRLVHEWSERKRHRYDPARIRLAWRRLEEAGLVSATVPDDADAGHPRKAERDPLPHVSEADLEVSAL